MRRRVDYLIKSQTETLWMVPSLKPGLRTVHLRHRRLAPSTWCMLTFALSPSSTRVYARRTSFPIFTRPTLFVEGCDWTLDVLFPLTYHRPRRQGRGNPSVPFHTTIRHQNRHPIIIPYVIVYIPFVCLFACLSVNHL